MIDVVVVGAGPSGSSAALRVARTGRSVLLVDRVELPRRKVCGACIGPAAAELLDGMGLRRAVIERGAEPLGVMELYAGDRRAGIRLHGNLALSRSALDELLATSAAEAGAEVRYGVRVERVRAHSDGVELEVRSEGVERLIRAGSVVDATGLGAGLSVEEVGGEGGDGGGWDAEGEVSPGSRIGIGAMFAASTSDVERGALRMVAGRTGYVGLVRVEEGRLNVAAALDREALASHGPDGAVAALLEEVGGGLPRGDPVGPWRGTPALTRRPARIAGRRVFRIGDAAGYVEPFTGEGIGWAISSGLAVAPFASRAASGWSDALAEGWTRRHHGLVTRGQRACRALAWALRHPRLLRAGVGVLSHVPRLAAPLVWATGRVPESSRRESGEPILAR